MNLASEQKHQQFSDAMHLPLSQDGPAPQRDTLCNHYTTKADNVHACLAAAATQTAGMTHLSKWASSQEVQ